MATTNCVIRSESGGILQTFTGSNPSVAECEQFLADADVCQGTLECYRIDACGNDAGCITKEIISADAVLVCGFILACSDEDCVNLTGC